MKAKCYFTLLATGSLLGCSGIAAEDIETTTEALCNETPRDLGREVLEPNDGWAAYDTGTTGGSLATSEQVYFVTNRAEFIAALNNGVSSPTSPATPSTLPKIIYVDGTIDFNVGDLDEPLTCADYYRNGYTPEAFREAYDPLVWGRVAPSGTLETARVASQAAQQARVAVSLRNADHVWVDHNVFEDRETADEDQPSTFDVLFQVHDGALDITNASDFVTVSFNRFRNHDKVMLIGSSDSATADRGKLRVTLHHNLFDHVGSACASAKCTSTTTTTRSKEIRRTSTASVSVSNPPSTRKTTSSRPTRAFLRISSSSA